MCRHPDLYLLAHHALARTPGQGRERWGLIRTPHTKAVPGPEKSSAWSAGGGNKLLPNQPRPVAGEELQPLISPGLQGYQSHFLQKVGERRTPSLPLRHPQYLATTTYEEKGEKSKLLNFSSQPTNKSTKGIRKLYCQLVALPR